MKKEKKRKRRRRTRTRRRRRRRRKRTINRQWEKNMYDNDCDDEIGDVDKTI